MTNAAPHRRFWNWARRLKSLGTWQSALVCRSQTINMNTMLGGIAVAGRPRPLFPCIDARASAANLHLGGGSPGIASIMRPLKMPFLGISLKGDGVGALKAKMAQHQ